MGNKYEPLSRFWLFALISSTTILLISCYSYNFSEPQPVDKANIYEFPDKFLGKWQEMDDTNTYQYEFTLPLNVNGEYIDGNRDDIAKSGPNISAMQRKRQMNYEEHSFYYITKKYVLLIVSEKEKIVKGAWPKLENGKEFIYPPDYFTDFRVLKTINYDSLNKPIDTIDNYIFNKDKIYEVDDDRYLNIGYRYYMEKDTITVLKNDTLRIDLGQNAFLRKLSDDFYAFNINNSILGFTQVSGWWRIILLENSKEGKLAQWECTSKTGKLSSMFYDRPSKYDIFYINSQWTSAEMTQLIKDGYFETSSVLSKIDD